MIRILTCISALLLGGAGLLSCSSGSYHSDINFNPAEPLRVAVLPFAAVGPDGSVRKEEGRLALDNLGLVSTRQEETPAQMMRRLVLNELKNTSFDLIPSGVIDIELPHHGFAQADGTIDMARVLAVDPVWLCSSFLTCDAVLYGRVTRFERNYYGLESVNRVALELTLLSAKDRRVLYSAKADDSESRGLTKGPTGLPDLVVEPIKGLDSNLVINLQRRMVQKMLGSLKMEAQKNIAREPAPAIYAVAHDATGGSLKRDVPLVVVLFGSEHEIAFFSIGNAVEQVPMLEVTPGHYYGEYTPLDEDAFAEQPVVVSLTDKYRRKSSVTVSRPALSLEARPVKLALAAKR